MILRQGIGSCARLGFAEEEGPARSVYRYEVWPTPGYNWENERRGHCSEKRPDFLDEEREILRELRRLQDLSSPDTDRRVTDWSGQGAKRAQDNIDAAVW